MHISYWFKGNIILRQVIQNKKRDIYEEDDELNDAIDNCYIGTSKQP